MENQEKMAWYFLDQCHDPVFWVDDSLRVIFANQATCRMAGQNCRDLQGKVISGFFLGQEFSAWSTMGSLVRKKGEGVFEKDCRDCRGRSFPAEIRGLALLFQGQGACCFMVRDISWMRSLEKSLQESERRFSIIFGRAGIGTVLTGLDNRFLEVNPVFCQMLGYEEDELLGKSFQELTHPDDRPKGGKAVRLVKNGELETACLEKRYVHKSGRIVRALVTISVLRNEEGGPLYFVAYAKDITKLRQAEAALRTTIKQLEDEKSKGVGILEAIEDYVSIQDVNYKILYQNQILKELVGDRVGEYCYAAYENREAVCEGCPLAVAFSEERSCRVERKSDLIDDETRWFDISASVLRDSEGEIVAGIEVCRDITEQKKTENKLRVARGNLAFRVWEKNEELVEANQRLKCEIVEREKAEAERMAREKELQQVRSLEAVGRLAAGIAHEINTPLTNASFNVQRLSRELARLPNIDISSPLRKIEALDRSIERASVIARELLHFSHQGKAASSPVDIHGVLQSALVLMQHRLRGVEVIYDRKEIPPVFGDSVKLGQVFINILANSVDAMPDGGELRIECSERNNFLCVSILDTGLGIVAQNKLKIFEPFFTTKEAGKGLGLGLSISYGIVKQYRGDMSVVSGAGRGCRVDVCLPVWQDKKSTSTCNR